MPSISEDMIDRGEIIGWLRSCENEGESMSSILPMRSISDLAI